VQRIPQDIFGVGRYRLQRRLDPMERAEIVLRGLSERRLRQVPLKDRAPCVARWTAWAVFQFFGKALGCG
jgi:RNase adaptor protein for sRNA GlmZ degradation